jgi:hypothetical protein
MRLQMPTRRTGLTGISRCVTASLKIIDSSFTQLATVAAE